MVVLAGGEIQEFVEFSLLGKLEEEEEEEEEKFIPVSPRGFMAVFSIQCPSIFFLFLTFDKGHNHWFLVQFQIWYC